MKNTIKSDTQGKLNKMIKGVVFSDPLVFITEFFQNSYRAKASEVKIEVNQEDGYIKFNDNGTGLDRAESLLVLDYSAWNTTTEGFGLGFWSWLCFDKDIQGINRNVVTEVYSNNYKFRIDKEEILRKNLDIEVEESEEKYEGFNVALNSDLIKDYDMYENIVYRVKEDGKYMPYKIYLNGTEIYQEEILDKNNLTKEEKHFDNELFEGILGVKNGYYGIKLFYEKREVRELYTVRGFNGRIELKASAINLKEPDRKDYVYDDKYYKFKDKLTECAKDFFKDYLKEATNKEINEYAEIISEYMSVGEYEKYLGIDDVEYDIDEEERKLPKKEEYYEEQDSNNLRQLLENRNNRIKINNQEITDDMSDKIQMLLNMSTSGDKKWVETEKIELNEDKWVKEEITEEIIKEKSELVIQGKVWVKYNTEKIDNLEKEDKEIESEVIKVNKEKKVKKETNIIEVLRKSRKKVWVKLEETEELGSLISKAQYYGIKVFVAKNVLYENVFKAKDIAHISEIEKGIVKKNIIKNVKIKSKKEQTIIDILQPVCEYYNIPESTFLIADLGMYVETTLKEKVVHREVKKNSKTEFLVKGLTDGENIYIDRKALRLKRFTINASDSFGKIEYKLLLTLIRVVSHELAHLLYDTNDNTIEHFEKQDEIMDELESLYNTLF